MDLGFKVIVWTVNEEKDVLRMISLGVDGIITDDLYKVIRILNQAKFKTEN